MIELSYKEKMALQNRIKDRTFPLIKLKLKLMNAMLPKITVYPNLCDTKTIYSDADQQLLDWCDELIDMAMDSEFMPEIIE